MRKLFLVSVTALLVTCGTGRADDTDDKLIQDLLVLLKNRKNSDDVRTTAVRALGALGWPGRAAVPDLIKFLNDAEERKAAADSVGPYLQVIESLGRLGHAARDAAPALVKAKGIAAPYDQAINQSLESILVPPAGTVYSLLASLRDYDPNVRLLAARALRAYPAEANAVLPALRESVARDPDPDVKRVAADSIQLVVSQEVARLVGLLKDRDDNVRVLAAKALGKMGSPAREAVPALQEAAAKDPDPDVQCVAKDAIRLIQQGTNQDVARFVGLLKDKDENVRMLAAKALGKMGPAAKEALPALKEVAEKDADPDVRGVAKYAMDRIAKP
jgi:HEAT repeat protein